MLVIKDSKVTIFGHNKLNPPLIITICYDGFMTNNNSVNLFFLQENVLMKKERITRKMGLGKNKLIGIEQVSVRERVYR